MKITSGQEWDFDKIEEIYVECKKIADEEYGLNYYPIQLEIISSEQMLDAYSSVGLPLFYTHWSFGEKFVKELEAYKRGYMGLAYEIVINSNPCIAYLMEENTMLMQSLVIAHAAFGHNHFFKNNYLFKQWTDADSIIDYLAFAKKYIRDCEEKYGYDEVEAVVDAVHSLQIYGVDKYTRPDSLSATKEKALRKDREDYIQSQLNNIWKTVPNSEENKTEEEAVERFPSEPQENILYFIEKNAPRLEDWKREIIRIIRKISQYFYPQRQTQVMNEGCLVEGSRITTEHGLMDIKTLVDTEYTGKVWDGNKWERVYDWFVNNDKPVIKIITNKGYEIFGGEDHKILIGNNWKKLCEMKIGDNINIMPMSEHEWVKNEPILNKPLLKKCWTDAEVCKMFDISTTTYWRYKRDSSYADTMINGDASKCAQVAKFLEENNDNISTMQSTRIIPSYPDTMTPELASWLGYLVGDGNVSYNSRIICLTSGDYSIIENFRTLTYKIFGKHINVVISKEENRYRAKISNAEILSFITNELNIKIGKSSSVKEIPQILFSATKGSVVAFIRSYFDADGCATKDGKVILVSNSKKLISSIQELLLYFNIFCSYRLQKDNTYHLIIDGINALYYRDCIGFGLQRKQDRLSILDNRKFLCRKPTATIEKIEISKDTTYDFSVTNSHQYYHMGTINHNCATFFHYKIIHELYKKGIIDKGAMLEFYASHTGVTKQPDFDACNYSGINPYALGFAMYRDIERVSMEPTDEDREWFANQDWVGNGDWLANVKWAVENFKDESFVQQFLSPKVMRDMRLFSVHDDEQDPKLLISGIHNKQGYKTVRDALSKQYNIGYHIPDIQVYNVDRWGDRSLTLRHYMVNKRPLEPESTNDTLRFISYLWGYNVRIESVDANNDTRAIYDVIETENILDIFLEEDDD